MTTSFEIIFDQSAIQKLSEKFTLVLFDVQGQEFESWPEPKEDAGEQARKVAGSGNQHKYRIVASRSTSRLVTPHVTN